MIKDLVVKARSVRRFRENEPIARQTLEALVDMARLTASGANKQPLKYYLSCDVSTNARIFPALRWAGALTKWPGPVEGERPAAYIVLLCDTAIAKSPGCDHGIAAQTMMLGAAEWGIGSCMVGSIDRDVLRKAIALDERYDIALVLAVGRPAETIVLDEAKPDGDTTYFRDDSDVHHVPKRALGDVIVSG